MSSTFELATRMAIKEIIEKNVSESKFGYVMTHEGLSEICSEIFSLLQTSRKLKAAGDRLIGQGFNPANADRPRLPPTKPL